MGRNTVTFSIVLILLSAAAVFSETMESPDGNIRVSFELRSDDRCIACPVYQVSYRDKIVIGDSRLGVVLANDVELLDGFQQGQTKTFSSDSSWTPLYGERGVVRDNFNQYKFSMRQELEVDHMLFITFRVFNEGVAIRYTVMGNPEASAEISQEITEFQFPGDFSAWQSVTAQGRIEKKHLSMILTEVERPLVVQLTENLYVAIAEAAVVDYPRMKLSLDSQKPPRLVSALSGPASGALPLVTPWRVIMVAESPARLLENNDIILNLNDPSAIEDTSWIKPGKVLREVTLTTDGGFASVDFAARHNMQYILFDAGWYGPENDDASDATTVTVDPARSAGPLDIRAVIGYGKQKGIGVILYVNHRALEKQLDAILPLYEKWGVAGIKFGFVNVGPQEWTSWLHDAVRKAADHHIMVDVHDEYRPTGYSRTYPNLMTVEGIRGDEEKQPVSQSLATLFTRMIAGPADNTICYFDSRVDAQSSHAYQLAKSVAFFSPWQFLYWYDRPEASPRKAGGAGGESNIIRETPELEFFDSLPTTWDDTRVLHGAIGEYAVIARRSGADWFIAAMNSEQPRTLEIHLNELLESGKKYTAKIFIDDERIKTPTHVRVDTETVTAADTIKIDLAPNGGQAIRIVQDKN